MDAANASGSRLSLRHALAGLQAGVLGALIMIGLLMIGSVMQRRSIWVVPNLFASTFYGANAYRNQFLRSSWTGVALLIALYGGLGAVWGCVWRDRSRARLVLYGALFGIVVHYILFHFGWNRVNGLMVHYAPEQQLALGSIVWGMILAKSPGYSRRIAEFIGVPAAYEESEVRSGEVIR
jgi:hypothetical protein